MLIQTKTLDEILATLSGVFYIKTTKQVANNAEIMEFVNKARSKNVPDFNIANLIKFENQDLVTFLRK